MDLTRELLSAIAQANPGDFAIYRLEGIRLVPLYAAPTLPAISGMSPGEYAALTAADAGAIVLESDRPKVAALLEQILLDGRDADFTYRILHKTQGAVWVHAKTRVLGALEGCPVLMTTFLNTSFEAEEHAVLLSHAIAMIYVVDLSTHELLFANAPALREWGHGSYSGKCCYAYVNGRKTMCPWCLLGQLRDGTVHADACYVPPMDRWFRVDVREMSWFGRAAAAIYAIDVTQRVRRQHSLETDKSALEQILSSVPGGVGVFCQRDGMLRLEYTNEGFFRTHRGSAAFWKPFMERDIVSWIIEPDRPAFLEEFARVRSGVKAQGSATYRVQGEDGALHWINNQFRPAYVRDGVQVYYSSFACIDEQKQAEEALEESRGALREAMANSDIQFFTYFPGRHRSEIDTLTRRLAKMPTVWENFPEDFLAYAKAAPEDAEAYRAMLRRIDEGADESECTVRFSYAGVPSWEYIHIRAVRDQDGKTVRAQGNSSDVTRQKLEEERLLQERLRLKTLEDSALEAFSFNISRPSPVQLHSSLAIRYGAEVSPALAEEADGLIPPEEFGGGAARRALLNIAAQIPDSQDRALFLSTCTAGALRRACSAGHFAASIRYRRRIGTSVRWVSTSAEVLPDPASGELIAFFHTRDIHTETVLEKVNAWIAARNYETVSYYDVQSGRIYVRSAQAGAAAAVSGLPYAAAIEQLLRPTVAEEEWETLAQKLTIEAVCKALEENPAYTLYFARTDRAEKLPGRPPRRMKNDMFYLDDHRDVIVFLLTDVTEIFEQDRDRREKLSQALAAAEQANVAKTEFLSRMSHEIRTPMNAIIGLDAIALQEKGLSDAMEDHLQKIGISARFLLSLINDILDMSRIESGRMTLKSEPFRFEDLIGSINTILCEQCRNSGLDYDCVLKSELEEVYVGDQTKLQQVLVNILGNAVKFTPRGGKIHFLIQQLDRTRETARLRFEVSDTGIGIDEAFLPHLFEAFSQENRGRTSAYGGTGLGLAISRNIVRLMGGDIQVHSIKNVGSSFAAEVELGLSEESIRRRELAGPCCLAPLHTLIVDDDVIVCRHTQIVLSGAGLKAEWVASGAEAVTAVKERRERGRDFDLILLDWKMPDMDGVETARAIRAVVGCEVTIIIMTAYDWTDIEERARAAGVDFFLKKPVFPAALAQLFARASRDRQDQPPLPAYDFTGRRVLLAEDNEINAEIACSLLGLHHCQVDVAENGATAIETFAGSPVGRYDAILMDVRMPVMDGLEAARTIRAMKRSDAKTIPILAMTANAFQDDVQASLDSGMNAHLAKPIEPAILYEALDRWISGRR